jgi:hypothetical protein
MKPRSLDILEKSKLPLEQIHAILKAMEPELAEHSDRLHESVVQRGELHRLELKMEDRFGRIETKLEAQWARWSFGCLACRLPR